MLRPHVIAPLQAQAVAYFLLVDDEDHEDQRFSVVQIRMYPQSGRYVERNVTEPSVRPAPNRPRKSEVIG